MGQPVQRTYGNWRRPRSPGIGDLDLLGSGVLVAGIVVVIITAVAAGVLPAIVVMLGVGGFLTSTLMKDRHGQSGLQRVFLRAGWWWTRSGGSHVYRSGPLGRAKWGSYQLPGVLAKTKLAQFTDAWGQPFGVLEMPHRGHYSVVFSVEPDGDSLIDQEQQDVWVARFGHYLNHLSDEPGVIAAAVTVETAPDSGRRLQDQVEKSIDPNAPAIARQVLREVVDTYPAGSAEIRAWVTLTFSSELHSRRLGVEEFAEELKPRLRNIGEQLHGTGAGAAKALSAQELCELVRGAYDPDAARTIEDVKAQGVTPPLLWSEVGPAASEACWDAYRHDGAVSVTWAMTGAPRGEVHSNILARLLAPSRQVARQRVSILYRIIDPGLAARQVEADKRSADFRANGKRPSERALRDQREAALTAQEEARGAGLIDFAMLVTATVEGSDPQALAVAQATVENLAATARISLRRLYGSQDSAFAGSLPLGLVLGEYLKVPKTVRKVTA
jgi:hypothetical protein